MHCKNITGLFVTSFEHEMVKKKNVRCDILLHFYFFHQCKLNALKLSQSGKTGTVKEVVMGIIHN